MGVFIPADYDVNRIQNVTEKRVAEALRDRLSDSWHIIANLELSKQRRPYEIDILLIHQEYGLVALEVKGGPVEIREGLWCRRDETFSPSPATQSKNSAYALRDALRELGSDLRHLNVAWGVVLFDVTQGDFGTIPELERPQLFLQNDIMDARNTVIDLALWAHAQSLTNEQLTDITDYLRPDVRFDWDPDSLARTARASLDRIMRFQTRALATLDQNPRVYIDGPAGTGKTRLALQWAQRSIGRGERTLVTCFNVPLGGFISAQFTEDDAIDTGHFEEVICGLPGLPPIDRPQEAGSEWFSATLSRHVLDNIDAVTVRYDTVIIDEIQDFFPEWIDVALALLEPDTGRLLAVGDANQALYRDGGVDRFLELEPARARLSINCRNTHSIGSLLNQMGGAEVAPSSPDGDPIDLYETTTPEDAAVIVRKVVNDMQHDEGRDLSQILVVTTNRLERDAVLAVDPSLFVPWDSDIVDQVICETVHRAKGLEYDTVVLVATSDDIKEKLLYVGASRAMSRLIVVGNPALSPVLGVD